MEIKVRTWKQVFRQSAALTVCCVLVSMLVTYSVLPKGHGSENLFYLGISGLLPLVLAGALSIFVLHQVRLTQSLADQLMHALNTDLLTGTSSRGHFFSHLAKTRSSGGFIVLLDADRFKSINDTYGHAVGDAALKHIAQIVKSVVGDTGVVGRMGGEEFAIRLPELSLGEARLLLASIATQLHAHGVLAGETLIFPTVSMGAVREDGKSDIDALLARADALLYQAKAAGRDRALFETLDETRALTA